MSPDPRPRKASPLVWLVVALGTTSLAVMVGLGAFVSGLQKEHRNPLAPYLLRLGKQIERPTEAPIKGMNAPYTIAMPNPSWWLRTERWAKKDNALSDRWLIRPDLDAHVLVIAEVTDKKYVYPDRYSGVVLDHMRAGADALTVIGDEPHPTYPQAGRVRHVRFTRQGVQIEALMATVSGFGVGFQVMGFSGEAAFSAVEPELRQAIASFRAPPSTFKSVAPEGYEPLPKDGRLIGLARPYSIAASPKTWYLRDPEDTKAQNAEVDRWIYRPDLDVAVLTVVERLPKGMGPDAFAEAAEQALRLRAAELEVKEKWSPSWSPKTARMSHARWRIGESDIEGYVLTVAEGGFGYTLQGAADRTRFEAVSTELRAVLDSFRLE